MGVAMVLYLCINTSVVVVMYFVRVLVWVLLW